MAREVHKWGEKSQIILVSILSLRNGPTTYLILFGIAAIDLTVLSLLILWLFLGCKASLWSFTFCQDLTAGRVMRTFLGVERAMGQFGKSSRKGIDARRLTSQKSFY
jgi:hypothetical protein